MQLGIYHKLSLGDGNPARKGTVHETTGGEEVRWEKR